MLSSLIRSVRPSVQTFSLANAPAYRSASSLAKVTLIGKVSFPPQQFPTKADAPNSATLTKLQVSTSESFPASEPGKRTIKTMYHNVITWDERIGGYIMDRVQQGCRVYIEGVLEYNEYTDKENNKRKVTNIRLRPGDGKVIITRAAPPAEEMPHEQGQGTAPRGQ